MAEPTAEVEERRTTPRVRTAAELRGQTARVLPVSPVEIYLDTPEGMVPLAVAAVDTLTPCLCAGDGSCRLGGVPTLRLILREESAR